MTSSKNQSKWKVYGLIVAIFAAVSLTVTALTTFATYPTSEHRNVAQRLAKLDRQAFTSEDFTKILDSEEYKALQSTSENSYSKTIDTISIIVQIAVEIGLIATVYYYLRKHRITSNPVRALVWINLAAFSIAFIPLDLIFSSIVGVESSILSSEMLFSIPVIILSALLVALYTYVIAKIINWHHNRRHGFAVE